MRMLTLLFLITFSLELHAICTAPTGTGVGFGKLGEVKLSTGTNLMNKLMVCDDTNWLDLPGSITATACTKNGEIVIQGGELHYCNLNVLWTFDSGTGTNGLCSKSGEMRWNAATPGLEFCNGTNWRTVSQSDTTADPISMTSLTNTSWDSFAAEFKQVTGFSGGIGTFTFNANDCINTSARVCADAACANPLTTIASDGNMYVPNGSYIRLALYTAGAPTSTCSISASVGGRNFTLSRTTAATDTSVGYAASFTEVRSATNGAVVTSNIVRTLSHSDVSANVSDLSTGGNPQFRICADASCSTEVHTWGDTPKTLSNNHYVQLRTTAGPTTNSLRRVAFSAGTGADWYWAVMTSTCPKTTTLAPGASLTCTCPANYFTVIGGVNGVGNYRQASDLCGAALHAGAFSNATGGTITVMGTSFGTPSGTCPSFLGGMANAVTSNAYATAATSMYFVGFGSDTCN